MSTSTSSTSSTGLHQHPPVMTLLVPVLNARGPGHHQLVTLPLITSLLAEPGSRYRLPVVVEQPPPPPPGKRHRNPNGRSKRALRRAAKEQRQAEVARLIRLNVQRAIAHGGLVGRRFGPGSF